MVIRLVYPALVSIGKEPIEQASLDGASAFQIWRFVESGMIQGVLLTALGYAAIISVGEFGASSFLAYGTEGTIPTLLFRLIARPGEQNYGMAMAVSAIMIFGALTLVYLASARGVFSAKPNGRTELG
jgi:thiamine transport system permease protein